MALTVNTIFCDDIRLEQQGKVTIVGTFSGAVLLPAYPASLPKLCVVVSLTIPLDTLPSHLKTVIYLGDDVLKSHEVTDLASPPVRGFPESIEGPEDAEFQWMGLDQYFTLAPLEVDAPKALRVKVFADGKEYKGAALYFVRQKPAP
jgi:hypothetical protein